MRRLCVKGKCFLESAGCYAELGLSQTHLHPAGNPPQPPALFTWAGEQPDAQEEHKVWPAVNPFAINHEANTV